MGNDLTDLASRVESRADEVGDAAEDGAEDGAADTRDAAVTELKRNDSDVTGELKHSILHRSEPASGRFVTRQRVIVTDSKGKLVEYGTGVFSERGYDAGSPSVEDILDWIVEKGITPTHYDNQVDLAWAITETIEELGTHAHPFMRPAWFRMEPRVTSSVASDVRRTLRRM